MNVTCEITTPDTSPNFKCPSDSGCFLQPLLADGSHIPSVLRQDPLDAVHVGYDPSECDAGPKEGSQEHPEARRLGLCGRPDQGALKIPLVPIGDKRLVEQVLQVDYE